MTVGPALPVQAATNEILRASEYGPAEAVYGQFLHTPTSPKQGWRTNLVYCLSYGRSNSPLTADFMARFAATPLRVITDTDALLFAVGGAYQTAPLAAPQRSWRYGLYPSKETMRTPAFAG